MSDFIVNYAKIMRAEMDRVAIIAGNTANASTPGYQARTASLDGVAFNALLEGKHLPILAKGLSSASAALKATENSADVAIRGDGYFLLTDGASLYASRNGKTITNADGAVVHQSGLAFVGENGESLALQRGFSVSADGSVLIAGSNIGKLKIVKLGDVGDAIVSSTGLIKLNNVSYAGAENFQVSQGYLTESNVDVAEQMTQLMTATRHLESVQRAILAYDNILESGINQIGK